MPVREAEPEDLPAIRALLAAHAIREGGPPQPAEDMLETALFGPERIVRVTIAESVTSPGSAAGLAMWYPTFSSWELASGVWLDDLFVKEQHRKEGLGGELMAHLRAQTDGRIEWDVSHGNDGAEQFYLRLGARRLDGWTRYRWLPD